MISYNFPGASLRNYLFNRNRIWGMYIYIYIWLFCNLMKFDYVKVVIGEKEKELKFILTMVDFSIEFSAIEN